MVMLTIREGRRSPSSMCNRGPWRTCEGGSPAKRRRPARILRKGSRAAEKGQPELPRADRLRHRHPEQRDRLEVARRGERPALDGVEPHVARELADGVARVVVVRRHEVRRRQPAEQGILQGFGALLVEGANDLGAGERLGDLLRRGRRVSVLEREPLRDRVRAVDDDFPFERAQGTGGIDDGSRRDREDDDLGAAGRVGDGDGGGAQRDEIGDFLRCGVTGRDPHVVTRAQPRTRERSSDVAAAHERDHAAVRGRRVRGWAFVRAPS